MAKKPKIRQSLEEILQSTSDALFPDNMGKQKIEVNTKDVLGDTPLHIMTERNDVYAVKLLIEHGADVNACGDMSQTPLHIAAYNQNFSIMEALLKAGAKNK